MIYNRRLGAQFGAKRFGEAISVIFRGKGLTRILGLRRCISGPGVMALALWLF